MLDILGQGSFGVVLRCRDLQTKAEVAVKVVPRSMAENINQEVLLHAPV